MQTLFGGSKCRPTSAGTQATLRVPDHITPTGASSFPTQLFSSHSNVWSFIAPRVGQGRVCQLGSPAPLAAAAFAGGDRSEGPPPRSCQLRLAAAAPRGRFCPASCPPDAAALVAHRPPCGAGAAPVPWAPAAVVAGASSPLLCCQLLAMMGGRLLIILLLLLGLCCCRLAAAGCSGPLCSRRCGSAATAAATSKPAAPAFCHADTIARPSRGVYV